MKSLCIVPFTKKEYSLLPCLDTIYEIGSLVSPCGIGLEGEDAATLLNLESTGYRITNDLEKSLVAAEVVLISDISDTEGELYKYALNALTKAVELKKDILCFLPLENHMKENIQKQAYKSKISCRFFDDESSAQYSEALVAPYLNDFHVPVFCICQEVPDCDSYTVFLKFAQRLQKAGKRVLAISEDRYNLLFGYKYLRFGFSNDMESSVLQLNALVQRMQKAENPEAIILNYPYPLLRFDNINPFDSGLTAYLISQALPADASIYCILSDSMGGYSWQHFNQLIQNKFGFPVSAVHVSNQIMDHSFEGDISALRIPESQVNLSILNSNNSSTVPFFNLLSKSDFEKFFQQLYEDYFDLPYGVIS